ncbi:MAG: hypothetical protein R3B74_16695 [Nitrospirales bacterium]|nr:hypothetical protein [Nitrospirales bacterium]
MDRLSIVAHDRFQEIINEANRPESLIHLQALVLSPEDLDQKTKTVVSQSRLDTMLGIKPSGISGDTSAGIEEAKAFSNPEERVAQVTRDVIRNLESQPRKLPSVTYLTIPEIRAEVIREVRERYRPAQLVLEGIAEQPDIAAVVAKTSELVIQQTIDIPHLVVPKGEVQSGFKPFVVGPGHPQLPPSEALWIQYLRTGVAETVGLGKGNRGNTP